MVDDDKNSKDMAARARASAELGGAPAEQWHAALARWAGIEHEPSRVGQWTYLWKLAIPASHKMRGEPLKAVRALMKALRDKDDQEVLWAMQRIGAIEEGLKTLGTLPPPSGKTDEKQPAAAGTTGARLPERTDSAEAHPLRNYDPRKQRWQRRPLPRHREESPAAALQRRVDAILLVAVAPTELEAVLRRLKPPAGERAVIKTCIQSATYYVGRLGSQAVALTLCEAGATGRRGSALAAKHAIDTWHPAALVLLGIAFGADPSKQKIGDVLVSTKVICYEPKRVGKKETVNRGAIVEPGAMLLDRFRHATGWDFRRPDRRRCEVRLGAILSGEKLIDNAPYKAEMLGDWPEAVGGEMEAAGVYAAADSEEVDWIVVKAICDWADGEKNKLHQPLAAAAAVSLVEHVFRSRNALSQATDRPRRSNSSSPPRATVPAKVRPAPPTSREHSARSAGDESSGVEHDVASDEAPAMSSCSPRKLGNLGAWWSGAHETVAAAIRDDWRPERLSEEEALRNHLAAFLGSVVPEGVRVETGYPHAGGHVGVYVSWPGAIYGASEILVEICVGLTRMSEYDRLVGQLERIGIGSQLIIVVLCGATNPRLVARLHEKYGHIMTFPNMDGALSIIEKPTRPQ